MICGSCEKKEAIFEFIIICGVIGKIEVRKLAILLCEDCLPENAMTDKVKESYKLRYAGVTK